MPGFRGYGYGLAPFGARPLWTPKSLNPLAWWKDSSGITTDVNGVTQWNNAIGSSYYAEDSGTPATQPAWAGSGYAVDYGVDDYLEINGLDINTTNQFGFMAWVNWNVDPNDSSALMIFGTAASGNGCYVGVSNTSAFCAYGDAYFSDIHTNLMTDANVWYHVVFNANGSTFDYQVNKVSSFTPLAYTGVGAIGETVRLGGRGGSSSLPFKAKISNPVIRLTPFSANEIEKHYNYGHSS